MTENCKQIGNRTFFCIVSKDQSIKERVPKRTRSFYRETRQERMPLKAEKNEAGTDASKSEERKKERLRSFSVPFT